MTRVLSGVLLALAAAALALVVHRALEPTHISVWISPRG
jgi:hypothetical protein